MLKSSPTRRKNTVLGRQRRGLVGVGFIGWFGVALTTGILYPPWSAASTGRSPLHDKCHQDAFFAGLRAL
jgi:hypothetical protein